MSRKAKGYQYYCLDAQPEQKSNVYTDVFRPSERHTAFVSIKGTKLA